MTVLRGAPHRSDLDRALAGEDQLLDAGEAVMDIAPARREQLVPKRSDRGGGWFATLRRGLFGGRSADRRQVAEDRARVPPTVPRDAPAAAVEPDAVSVLGTAGGRRALDAPEAVEAQAGSRSGLPAALSEPRIEPEGKPPKPRTIGIVFVHGIGSQLPDATLIDWGSSLVRAISAWQEVNHDDLVGTLGRAVRVSTSETAAPQPLDPVAGAQMDFVGDTLPVVRLNIPGLKSRAADAAGKRQIWLLTESWWASRVAPPSFATMVDWCGRQGIVARVAQAILREDDGSGKTPGRLGRATGVLGLGLFLSVLSTLALFAFGLLRTIAALVPIDAIKNTIAFAQFDTFLTTWWGDTYVLLRNPVEAANIRLRLAETIIGLRKMKADAIVVIGHSGGTIVSYTTLSDPGLLNIRGHDGEPEVRADLLITHAEAINLARNLTATLRQSHAGAEPADGVRTEVEFIPTAERTSRDGIRADKWIDFWASRDPAPNGPLDECTNPSTTGPGHPLVTCNPVWNRMSISEDHGTYWDNDEEFVLPVLRQLDLAGLDPAKDGGSRFDTYAGGGSSADWELRHRQRVWILAFWRRVTFILPFAAILLAILRPNGFFAGAATAAGWAWSAVGADKLWGQIGDLVAMGQPQPFIRLQMMFLVLAMTAFGVALVALVVHSLGGIGKRKDAWPAAAGRARLAEALASLVAPVALGLLVLAGRPAAFATDVSCIDLRAMQLGPFTTPPDLCLTPYFSGLVLGIALAFLLGLLALRAIPTQEPPPAPQRATVVFGLTAIGIVTIFAIAVSFATDAQTRIWIVGAVATIVLFRRIDGFGATRWARWDETERAAARRREASAPNRIWPAVQAVLILGSALAVALGIATVPGAFFAIAGSDLLVGGIVVLLIGAVVMVVVDGASAESLPERSLS